MQPKTTRFFIILSAVFLFFSCQQPAGKINTGYTLPFSITDAPAVLHENQDQLTQVIIYDVFSPPVASRIYAYTSLASYEAVRFESGMRSLATRMNGFGPFPEPEPKKKYDFTLAATHAFFTVAHKVVFSVDSLKKYEDAVFAAFRQKINDDSIYNHSIDFGQKVAAAILVRANKDNYTKSRGKEKFLGSEEPGKWRPTQPDYLDGVEWCWNEMMPFVMDSASQFGAEPPPAYSTDTNSVFFRMVKDVYDVKQNLTAEQKKIAKFWDDNPFVIEHSGHLSFATKKITPGGHWMGITAIASKMTNANAGKTAYGYAATAVALFEGFLSCWDEKYKWQYVRPVTVINQYIDKTWSPLLQTPPFPEYTSGHSMITATAATVLTQLYGDGFAFRDTSDLRYIGMERSFKSFNAAAEECSISRVYGGIHYRLTVDRSAVLGRRLGALIIDRLGMVKL